MKYKVIWSDGNAAASRGGAPDKKVDTTVECDPKNLWAVLHMMKDIGWLDSVDGGFEDPDFKAGILDYFGVDSYDDDTDEDGEYMIEIFKSTEEDFEDANLDDIDGGAPWVLRVVDESGNVLYECDDSNEYLEMDYDEAYEFLIDHDIDPDTAEEILDDLESYTEGTLVDAISELTESLSTPEEKKSTELTEEEVKKYLIDNGFPESSASYVASLSQTDSSDRCFRNPSVLEQFVKRADLSALRKSMLIFKLFAPDMY